MRGHSVGCGCALWAGGHGSRLSSLSAYVNQPVSSLLEAKEILWKNRIEKLPIVDDENRLVGLITSKDIDNVGNYPNACKDASGRLRCGAAVGLLPPIPLMPPASESFLMSQLFA